MALTDKPGQDGAAVERAQATSAGLSTQPHQPRYNADGSGGPGPKYMRTEELLGRTGTGFSDRLTVKFVEKLIGIGHVNSVCLKAGTPWPSSVEMIDHLFREFDIKWRVTNPEMFRRLEGRSAVFVSNHPYGMADAFAVNNMLERYRPNFRLFANAFLTSADSITHKLLFVDPFMNENSRAMNRRSMMTALKHLKEGGDLALFPGRLCSHLKWGQRCVQDGEWTDQVRIFVEAGGADLVPVHVSGRNSWLFQTAGLIHPKLRTLLLMREFSRGGHDFAFTLGEPVPAETLIKAGRITAPGQIARALTYSANPVHGVAGRGKADAPVRLPQAREAAKAARNLDAIPLAATDDIRAELENWPVLVEHGGLRVHNVRFGLPQQLARAVAQVRFDAYAGGAAVASPLDLIDEFDRVYSHLVLWDENAQRIAGSYRYIIPARIEGGVDPADLVTASIFRLKQPFLDILPKALELGRAAIGIDYQRSYAPLMLMWRGIMDILRRDKSIKYLIGPVTIPQSFSALSRHVLKRFLETHCADPKLAGFAEPRHRFNAPLPPQVDVGELIGRARTVPEIGCVIEALEHGARKLPVLYRQYDNIGLRYVATGEWPELDHAMASLAVLDLTQARRDFIQRYLGKQDAEAFFEGR
ncbi:MAG: lysophospholipid acyltransferase family protein [Nitratireductor sp.]|nr:lysophospholipid acyltransferase family protein [Nitratireductor sp.]